MMQPHYFSVLIALAVSLFAWALIDGGSRLLQAWRLHFTARSGLQLRALFLAIDPARLFAANFALSLLLALLLWLLTARLELAAAGAALLAVTPLALLRWLRQRRFAALSAQLPDALQLLAASLRAGLSLSGALQQLARELPPPLAQELQLLQHEQRLGVSLDDALENLALRVPLAPLQLLVATLRMAADSGGSLAATLQRSAASLRQQQAIELKLRALTAQGSLQAWVVGLMPLLLLYVLHALEPQTMALLWTTRSGWAILAIVAAMEICAIVLIRRIIRIEL